MTTNELNVAEEAARAAAMILTRHFRQGVTAWTKDVANLVTEADLEAERAIVEAIHRHYPTHEILGEESHQGNPAAEHLWVVDPLDGTANFAHRIPQFAVSIAYYHHGRAESGMIVNPVTDDWYVVARGQGASHNGRRVEVSGSKGLGEVIVGVGFPYDRGALMEATLAAMGDVIRAEVHGVRRLGSAALDLCLVGTGQYGAFFEYQLSEWDFAAGRLFVEEAGGRVSDANGGPLPMAKTSVLATNGPLHDPMLALVRPHHPPLS